MKDLTTYQEATISIVMRHGKADAITGKEIAKLIGLVPRASGKEGADMRAIIHALRVKGYPVCASGTGYYWPQTQEELSEYIASLQARILDQSAAYAGISKGFDKVGSTPPPEATIVTI